MTTPPKRMTPTSPPVPTGKKLYSRRVIICLVLFLVIPLIVFLGIWLFRDRKYHIISMIVAILSCVPFFVRFEHGKNSERELVIIAVMTAFSVIGRLIFMPLPGFKPVTAITVIAGIAMGPEAGFMVGSLTAIVSNIFFGQGPWTPFQMFVWGCIGFFTGLLFFGRKRPHKLILSVIGAVSGILFSILMDVWSVISIDGAFLWTRYAATLISSLPFMAVYAVSNIVFLWIMTNPFLDKLDRIKKKYGVFPFYRKEKKPAR